MSPTFSHLITFEDNASVGHLSPRFRDESDLCQLSIDMTNLLDDICAYTKHIEHLPLPWSETDHGGLLSRGGELEVRLLVLGSDYNNPSSVRTYSPVAECMFLALRVFLRMMPQRFSWSPMGCKLLAARINLVLSKVILLPSWHAFANLLLWVVFMTSIVSRAGITKEQDLSGFFAGLRQQVDLPLQFDDVSEDDETYWILKLAELSSLLRISSKDDIKRHLERFLWVDSLCDVHSRDIWEGLEAVQTVSGSS